jgi:DNA invertase Pin-like site-specific DNA recombinase
LNIDLSTPSGRLMFQIIGAMAEFERALIQERVRAGLRNARAKGRRLGRPRVIVDTYRIAFLRAQGRSWAQIKDETGISKGTAQRAVAGLPKIGQLRILSFPAGRKQISAWAAGWLRAEVKGKCHSKHMVDRLNPQPA